MRPQVGRVYNVMRYEHTGLIVRRNRHGASRGRGALHFELVSRGGDLIWVRHRSTEGAVADRTIFDWGLAMYDGCSFRVTHHVRYLRHHNVPLPDAVLAAIIEAGA